MSDYPTPTGGVQFRQPISFARPELRTPAEQAALEALQSAGPRQYSRAARQLMAYGAVLARLMGVGQGDSQADESPELAYIRQRLQQAGDGWSDELLRLAALGAQIEIRQGGSGEGDETDSVS